MNEFDTFIAYSFKPLPLFIQKIQFIGMLVKTILAVASVFAIYWAFKTKRLVPTIISLGLITSTILVLYTNKTIQPYGLYTYLVFIAIAFIYGLIKKDIGLGSRIIICLMSSSIFVYWIWIHNHWHGNTILLPIFALLVGLAAIVGEVKLKNELGFIVILAADALAILLENYFKAM